MTSHVATTFGFAVIGAILLAVLGAVDRREKFAFVAGVVLVTGGSLLVGALPAPHAAGKAVAVVGIAAILWSTVPLLRQSATIA